MSLGGIPFGFVSEKNREDSGMTKKSCNFA
jgi:hypothetical protein